MFSPSDIERSATVVITHRVRPQSQADYEQWLGEIIPLSKSYPGHLGVQVIRPIAESTPAYTVIIRFDTRDNLLAWMRSPDRKRVIEKAQPFLADDENFRVLRGWDFWFTPEGAKTKLPTRWKQFVVTWSAIYPLVLLMPLIIAPAMHLLGLPDTNHYLKMFFVTCAVVALMTYVVMPRYTKLIHRWLFN